MEWTLSFTLYSSMDERCNRRGRGWCGTLCWLLLCSILAQIGIAWALSTWGPVVTNWRPSRVLVPMGSMTGSRMLYGAAIQANLVNMPLDEPLPNSLLGYRTGPRPPIAQYSETQRFGLPWPCLQFSSCTYLYGFTIDPDIWYTTTSRSALFVHGAEFLAPRGADLSLRGIPLDPYWPGLLVGVLCTASLVGGGWLCVIWLPPTLRRRLRLKRGCCPHCGYSREGWPTPTCPECGELSASRKPLLVSLATVCRTIAVVAVVVAAVALIQSARRVKVWPSVVAAARDGDRVRLAELLSRGADIESSTDPHFAQQVGSHLAGFTPLMAAARYADGETVSLLIDRGANIEARSRSAYGGRNMCQCGGYTPLMFAVDARRVDNVEALLAAGADVNAKSVEGMGPLEFAMLAGDWELADQLRVAGARFSPSRIEGLIGWLSGAGASAESLRYLRYILDDPTSVTVLSSSSMDWPAYLDGSLKYQNISIEGERMIREWYEKNAGP